MLLFLTLLLSLIASYPQAPGSTQFCKGNHTVAICTNNLGREYAGYQITYAGSLYKTPLRGSDVFVCLNISTSDYIPTVNLTHPINYAQPALVERSAFDPYNNHTLINSTCLQLAPASAYNFAFVQADLPSNICSVFINMTVCNSANQYDGALHRFNFSCLEQQKSPKSNLKWIF
ncbi:hypothetical protein BC833DRAFT_590128 [Globomyces pollinis-pini]|nr:hypothetical protein BC833DRAFT_590128 [Globomyces pollinis-pini]KAJ2996805.1 hypothetical protein HDV02_006183 [Globomyces sp. JEL0801]